MHNQLAKQSIDPCKPFAGKVNRDIFIKRLVYETGAAMSLDHHLNTLI